jgi:hypothetical protein
MPLFVRDEREVPANGDLLGLKPLTVHPVAGPVARLAPLAAVRFAAAAAPFCFRAACFSARSAPLLARGGYIGGRLGVLD